MTTANIATNQSKLINLLASLKSGLIQMIEYGELCKPNGYFTAIRITYINTAGGFQYRICKVNRLGIEGSGIYSQDEAVMLQWAEKFLHEYDEFMSHPVAKKAFQQNDSYSKKELDWHGYGLLEQTPRAFHLHEPLEGEIVVTLSI